MRALHLVGVGVGNTPPFSFPSKPPTPSDLVYTASGFPDPQSFSLNANVPPTPTYLIRVLTTALTRGELTWRETLDPSRFHPYGSAIPGHDVVGVVEKVLANASGTTPPQFSVGDSVWALIEFDRDGAAATYTIAYEDELSLIPVKPSTFPLSESEWHDHLATVPLSGLTAYQTLFTHGGLASTSLSSSTASPVPGAPRILVLGASGSVGVPTVSLAKTAGFHITAVCSSSSRSLVSDVLHADEIIDYSSPNFTSIPATFAAQALAPVDLVVDCIGASLLVPILKTPAVVLRPSGRIVTIVAPIETMIDSHDIAPGISAKFFIVRPSGADLSVLGDLIVQDRLQMHVDAVYGLEQGREAMELVESRGKKKGGKVVLRVAERYLDSCV